MGSSPDDAGQPAAEGTPPVTRGQIWAWAMYDWANSAYTTLSITVMMLFIKDVVLPGRWGKVAWPWGIGISMFVAALLSPILGAMADANASKRRWLAGTALSGSVGVVIMAFVPAESTWLVLGLFFAVSLCFELSFGFYNGFLPEISTEKNINRISAYGYALGYVGGGLALGIAVAVLTFGGALGLPEGDALTMDYHETAAGRFEVALPDGKYDVTLTLGDPAARRGGFLATLEDGQWSQSFEVPRGAPAERTAEVEVYDGGLTLDLITEAAPSATRAAINGLTIRRDGATVAAFDFGTAGSAAQPGRFWLTPEDGLNIRTQEVLAKRYKKTGNEVSDRRAVEAVPRTFGWKSGVVASRDAVLPMRLRIGLVIMGLWWGVFTLPTILYLHDRGPPRGDGKSLLAGARSAVGEVRHTLWNIRRYRTLALFLVGWLFLNDGIQTVISQSSLFASEELDFDLKDLITLILAFQFICLPGAFIMAYVADRVGQKPTLMLCIAIWVGLLIGAWFVQTKLQFWILSIFLGLVMGGTQSICRAVMGTMTPPAHNAEFFGFFNFSGKATSWIGTILFGTIIYLTGSSRLGILSLLALFILGWLFIWPVNVARGRAEARGGGPPSDGEASQNPAAD